MSITSKYNLSNNKFCQSTGSTLSLSGLTNVGFVQYLTDRSAEYNARSITDAGFITGITSNLQSQIDFVSGNTLTGTTNGITAVGQNIELGGDLSKNTTINLNTNQLQISGSSGYTYFENGIIKYGGDYSSFLDNRSIPDKEYVDNNFNSIVGSNGITRVDDNITLGGILTGDTTISGDSKTLNFGSSNSSLTGLTITSPYYCLGDAGGNSYLTFEHDSVQPSFNLYMNDTDNGDRFFGIDFSSNLTAPYINLFGSNENNGYICFGLRGSDNNTGGNYKLSVCNTDLCYNERVDLYSTGGKECYWKEITNTVSGDTIKFSQDLNTKRFSYDVDGTPILTINGDNCVARYNSNITLTNECDLTHKAYVDSLIAEGITGATNGLTKINRNVKLGGVLSENTEISGETSHCLSLGTTSSALDELFIRSTNGIEITSTFLDNYGTYIKAEACCFRNYFLLPTDGGYCTGFDFDSSQFIIHTEQCQNGMQYAADYSANFIDRSIPDKAYVDSIATGLNVKASVLASTTEGNNIDLSGGTFGGTLDGVSITDGNRVLIKDQTDASTNGVWIYSAGTNTFYRAPDYDGSVVGEVSNGDIIPVNSGTTNANTRWVLTTSDPIIVGVDDLSFSLFGKSLDVEGGDGINVNLVNGVEVLSVDLTTNSGLDVSSSGLTISNLFAGSGLTITNGILNINASSTPISGTPISVKFDGSNNLAIDSDDVSNNKYSITATTSSTINLTGEEYVVLVQTSGGSVTVNLPTSPDVGDALKIKDMGDALTNNITVDSGVGKLIDDEQTALINTNYGALELVYDGNDKWFVLSFVN